MTGVSPTKPPVRSDELRKRGPCLSHLGTATMQRYPGRTPSQAEPYFAPFRGPSRAMRCSCAPREPRALCGQRALIANDLFFPTLVRNYVNCHCHTSGVISLRVLFVCCVHIVHSLRGKRCRYSNMCSSLETSAS